LVKQKVPDTYKTEFSGDADNTAAAHGGPGWRQVSICPAFIKVTHWKFVTEARAEMKSFCPRFIFLVLLLTAGFVLSVPSTFWT